MPAFLSPAELLRPPLWEWFALALGLIVGSFANVCICRLAQEPRQSVVSPPSRCPKCGSLIRPWDNIPILSYLLLLGRCRTCRAAISLRYPAVEAVNGAAYFALASLFGPTPQAAVAMTLVTALLVLALIDLDVQMLPDVITLPGIGLGLAASFLPGSRLAPLLSAASALAGFGLLWGANEAYRRARGVDGFGGGDPKMAAMIGAFLGWQGMLLTVFIASLSGSLVGLALVVLRGRDLQHKLPLGTFMAIGGIAVLFAGDPLLAWYRGFFRG